MNVYKRYRLYISFSGIPENMESICILDSSIDSHAPLDSQHAFSNLDIILILILFECKSFLEAC